MKLVKGLRNSINKVVHKFVGCCQSLKSSIAKTFKRKSKKPMGGRYSWTKREVRITVPLFSMVFEQDKLVLSKGQHEIEVSTKRRPEYVWFNFHEAEGMPVCHGNIDRVGVKILPHGFVLYADIQSDVCTIEWFASVHPEEEHHHHHHEE